jgi:FtsP/CotA-like multicopper oxidase with cupredoxin domain
MTAIQEQAPPMLPGSRGMSRRQVLKLGALAALGVMLPVSTSIASMATGVKKSPSVALFARDLRIPPVLAPTRRDATTDYYELTQRLAQVEILTGLATTIWGYDGQFPGPTIKARTGRTAVIRQTNLLPEPVAVHQHGGLTPPDSDGYPTDLIPPGGTKEYVYPNQRRASTMWYHDHAMDQTGRHVYLGLAGFYIIEDEIEDSLPLPKGDYDVPLLLQDRLFAADGSLAYNPIGHVLTPGDTILVNGTPWPRFAVANRKYRFRILNGSNSRVFKLTLSTGQTFVQIGTDGGLLPAPVESPSISLAMAERAEVVLDFSRYPIGTQIVLGDLNGDGNTAQIMRFDVTRQAATDDSRVPATLRPFEAIPESAAVRSRTFVFGPKATLGDMPPVEWLIDGQHFDPNRIDATPELNSVEIWRFISEKAPFGGGMEHPVHVHLVNFQILDRNGAKPAPYESGWKDTVLVPRGEEVRVIMKFEGYRGKYIMHCHNLSHEDSSMMTNFEVR